MLCNNDCTGSSYSRPWDFVSDGICQDGGPGAEASYCDPGTDCVDCGPYPRNPQELFCTNTCEGGYYPYASNGECNDGGPGQRHFDQVMCALGTDCADCGPRYMPPPPPSPPAPPPGYRSVCYNSCDWANGGSCNDGGPGAEHSSCALGTDCADCGLRFVLSQRMVYKADLTAALEAWVADQAAAEAKYGHISTWDVTRVTDFSQLLCGFKIPDTATQTYGNYMSCRIAFRNFNADISAWDVSRVTIMSQMFREAQNFNSRLESWDVSSVTDMSFMVLPPHAEPGIAFSCLTRLAGLL